MKLITALSLIAFSFVVPARASVIFNGSFESGTDPGSFTDLVGGDNTTISNWLVTLNHIDYVGTQWTASNGTRSLDLEGSKCNQGTPDCAGGIAQTFTTIAGHTYNVLFDLAGNPASGPTIKTILVQAAGQNQTFTFDTTGKTFASMGWLTKTWSFTASGTSTTLEFDTADSPNSGFGPTLDNVVVDDVTVPEPGSLVLVLAGIGALALNRWRGRRLAEPETRA